MYFFKCNGKGIKWAHMRELYKRDTSAGLGVWLLPKLNYEHVALTSFSKMRVDLAAQVAKILYTELCVCVCA